MVRTQQTDWFDLKVEPRELDNLPVVNRWR